MYLRKYDYFMGQMLIFRNHLSDGFIYAAEQF